MTHVLIVNARFYADIADALLKGAETVLRGQGVTYDIIDVPGAFEIPGAIRFALGTGTYDGFLALGCVIRGETTHYDYVCNESARGLMELTLTHQAALGYGILTVENMEQAKIRADIRQGDKGGDVAKACLRMIELKRMFGATK